MADEGRPVSLMELMAACVPPDATPNQRRMWMKLSDTYQRNQDNPAKRAAAYAACKAFLDTEWPIG